MKLHAKRKQPIKIFTSLIVAFILEALLASFLFNHRNDVEITFCNTYDTTKKKKSSSVKASLNKKLQLSFGNNNKKKTSPKNKRLQAHEKIKKNKKITDEELKKLLGKKKYAEHKQLLKRLKNTSQLKSQYKKTSDNLLPGKRVPKSYIYRKRDYEDIIVKDVFPTLDDIHKPFKDIIKDSSKKLIKHTERNEIISDYRKLKRGEIFQKDFKINLTKEKISSKNKPILKFSKEERKHYFDRMLTQGSKEEQLADFLQKYIHFDPNKGDLPIAIRELYYKNLQRIAYSFSYDMTYFILDYFQENLNKEDFLKNSLYQVAELKNSKASIELLFAIENIYDIQQRALSYPLSFQKQYPYFSKKKKMTLRVETIRRVVERYTPILKEKNIKNIVDVNQLYTRKRIEIMDFILDNNPNHYRVKDALFEKGFILWQRGKFFHKNSTYLAAIQIWKSINTTPSTGDFLNQKTYKKIMNIIQNNDIRQIAKNLRLRNQINQILRTRLQKQLIEKIAREKRLLWH